MTLAETLLPEFEQEMVVTRRLLARVPGDRGEWRPHPKSFPLAHLAQLVARMPGWIPMTIDATELDIAASAGYSYETTETLLTEFDRGVDGATRAIRGASEADFDVPWTLKMGQQVFFTLPRRVVVRQHVNHLIHHRGQLTVYLRLCDVPLPSIYGPTADEKWA